MCIGMRLSDPLELELRTALWVLELNSCPPEGQPILLTIEPSPYDCFAITLSPIIPNLQAKLCHVYICLSEEGEIEK